MFTMGNLEAVVDPTVSEHYYCVVAEMPTAAQRAQVEMAHLAQRGRKPGDDRYTWRVSSLAAPGTVAVIAAEVFQIQPLPTYRPPGPGATIDRAVWWSVTTGHVALAETPRVPEGALALLQHPELGDITFTLRTGMLYAENGMATDAAYWIRSYRVRDGESVEDALAALINGQGWHGTLHLAEKGDKA